MCTFIATSIAADFPPILLFFFHTTFPFAMRACLLLPPFTLCTVKYCTHFAWCVHIFLRIPQFRIILILVSCSYAARASNCGTGAEMRFSLLYICFPAFCYFSCSRSPRLRSLQTRKCMFLQIFFFFLEILQSAHLGVLFRLTCVACCPQ